MVEKVEMYKAKSGALFYSREEAEQDDRNGELAAFLKNILEPHNIYGKMNVEDAIDELVAHADELRAILTGILTGITVEEGPQQGLPLDVIGFCEDCRDVMCRCP